MEAGWGEGSAEVRMLGQLSPGASVRHSSGQRSRSPDYVLKAALSSRKAAWRILLFSSSCFRSSCSAFSSASNLLAEDKAWTCEGQQKETHRVRVGKRNLDMEHPANRTRLQPGTRRPGLLRGKEPGRRLLPGGLPKSAFCSRGHHHFICCRVTRVPDPWGRSSRFASFSGDSLACPPITRFSLLPLTSK